MSELLPCPFCGCLQDEHEDWCYFEVLARSINGMASEKELNETWNTRAERTCKPIYPNDSDYREVEIARCSNCKRPIVVYESEEPERLANYCHYCGCKVVSE